MKTDLELFRKSADVIKTLGHPVRLQILCLLQEAKEKRLTVTEIYEELGLSQPETSHHLSVMKNLSVLRCEKNGSSSYYSMCDQYPFVKSLIQMLGKK
jgi:ArsR family transcriptional regulator